MRKGLIILEQHLEIPASDIHMKTFIIPVYYVTKDEENFCEVWESIL